MTKPREAKKAPRMVWTRLSGMVAARRMRAAGGEAAAVEEDEDWRGSLGGSRWGMGSRCRRFGGDEGRKSGFRGGWLLWGRCGLGGVEAKILNVGMRIS